MTDLQEREAAGRSLRKAVPRSQHAELPASNRDPVGLVLAADEGRDQDLVPIRHHRMAASAFTFFRGTADLMALDLAATHDTGIAVQCCGDAHLSNFGLFATPERRLTFDLNDFDETLPGPWEWDLKRLAASVHLAAEAGGGTGPTVGQAVEATVREYRERMLAYAGTATLDVWFDAIDLDTSLPSIRRAETRRMLEKVVGKARNHTSDRAVQRLTVRDGDTVRFRDDVPLMWRAAGRDGGRFREEDQARLDAVLERYRASLAPERAALLEQFRLVDGSRKVVGVGSVGTRCWILLMQGPQGPDDLVVLQAKESGPSALEPWTRPSPFPTHGERVVRGQRLMQAAGDPFLGHTADPETGVDAYVRQLWDMKGSIDPEQLDGPSLTGYGRVCGAVLARAHARSGRAPDIAGYLGAKPVVDQAIASFAASYATRARQDHEAFLEAIEDGRVAASPDR